MAPVRFPLCRVSQLEPIHAFSSQYSPIMRTRTKLYFKKMVMQGMRTGHTGRTWCPDSLTLIAHLRLDLPTYSGGRSSNILNFKA